MKQWLETRQVLHAIGAFHAAGQRAALATVVRVNGSAYRHEGAKLCVCEDGTSVGNVSGGCLEADVREVAQRVIATGIPERRTYNGGDEEIAAWNLGVGCNGEVEILIEPVRTAHDAERIALAEEVPHAVITRLDGNDPYGFLPRLCITAESSAGSLGDSALDTQLRDVALRTWIPGGESRSVSFDGMLLFVDVLTPPPRLVIASASNDACTLAQFAADVGFRVVVADRRSGLLTPDRFPDGVTLVHSDAAQLNERLVLDASAFAVVMTHDFADDTNYLRALLRTPLRYIGMLGPRHRTERIVAHLRTEGTVDATRIFGPVGLDIGTDGAEQVALAVVAEMLAFKSGRQPQSLRDRRAPIHASND
jgi:xanthine dehydrogenase accessory factor